MISPISFGRAVKINAPIEIANKIAKSANSPVTVSGIDSFAKSIFTDTNIAKAKVVSVNPNEVYIFSGEEAKQQSKILKELKEKIDKSDELISSFSDDDTDEISKNKAIKDKYKEVYYAVYKMAKLMENGKGGRSKSLIDVQLKSVKIPLLGNINVIDKATYTSKKYSKAEVINYESKLF